MAWPVLRQPQNDPTPPPPVAKQRYERAQSIAHSAAHSALLPTAHKAQRVARGAQGPGQPGRPGPLRHAPGPTIFYGAASAAAPPLTNRSPGAPDAVAPVSRGGVSMPDLAHGRASSEET